MVDAYRVSAARRRAVLAAQAATPPTVPQRVLNAQMMRAMRDDVNEALRRVGAVHRLQRRSLRARDGVPVAHSQVVVEALVRGAATRVGVPVLAWRGQSCASALMSVESRERCVREVGVRVATWRHRPRTRLGSLSCSRYALFCLH